jgi:signal transduction histidine kinase
MEDIRRDHILSILLLAGLSISFVAFICVSVYLSLNRSNESPFNFFVLSTPLLFFSFLYVLAKKGFYQISAMLFVGLYFLYATYTAVNSGVDVPQALLIFALTIITGGILLGTRFAVFTTAAATAVLFAFNFLQSSGILVVNSTWKMHPVDVGDTAVAVVTMIVIMMVSWLYNREINLSLQRVKDSEAELKAERDALEVKVERRTRELQKAQLEKVMQLYRFAEFGRIASGLFHDLATPLTSVSLNLERIENGARADPKGQITAAARARQSLQLMEQFIIAARQQVQKQEVKTFFSVPQGINQVVRVLNYKAKKAKVKLSVLSNPELMIFGNALKFGQVITNVISNAIDSYTPNPSEARKDSQFLRREVEVRVFQEKDEVCIQVEDWGSGIPKKILPLIFQPLFTTKSPNLGMGIGLSISKDILEQDFFGSIECVSKEKKGTTFSLFFPLNMMSSVGEM